MTTQPAAGHRPYTPLIPRRRRPAVQARLEADGRAVNDLRVEADQPGHPLTGEWRRWAATSLIEGTPLLDVLSKLANQGFSDAESIRFCAHLYDDPAFEAGRSMAQRLGKVQSVLMMRERMRSLSSRPAEIDRRTGLSREEFLDRYYSQNTPVIMTDVCDSWAARTLWSPSYLVEKLGEVEVEVMAGRNSDPNYEVNCEKHRFVMPFDEYVAKIEAAEPSNDLYLVANNKLLTMQAAGVLWEDFELDSRFLQPDPHHLQAFLWFGPGGTITPLHHDAVNVLFNQVYGSKRFTLLPSLAVHRVYNSVGVYSDVDPADPDLERHPLFADAERTEFDLAPGESLFIPAGWWHHVEALESSISVSFTNFIYDNKIEWGNPTLPS